MFATLRKHQSWLLILIIGLTIISFTLYLDPSRSRSSGGGRQSADENTAGSINGQTISLEQFNQARREARLFFFLHFKKWPDRPDDMERAGFDEYNWAYERLLIDSVMKDMKITVSDVAAAKTTKQLFGIDPDKPLPKEEFDKFISGELAKNGVSLDDFDRFIRHQTGLEHLISLHGMSGRLITAKEAEVFYRRENEPMETEIVTLSISNYYPLVNISPKDLETYYTNVQATYRIPERVALNYIRFDLTNFFTDADKKIGAITNYNQIVDRTYAERGQTTFTNKMGKPMTADEAKAEIKKEHRAATAREYAGTKARDLINEIYKDKGENYVFTTKDIEAAAKANGLTVKTTAPFDERTGPREFAIPSRQANSMLFNLTDKGSSDQFYPTSPMGAEDAVYVIGFNQRFPSQAQPLSSVRDKVYADYRQEKAGDLLKIEGEKFQLAASRGLSKGENFDAIAASNNLKPKTLSHYSMASKGIPEMPERGDFEMLQQITFTLPTGKCSSFVPIETGGMVAYLKARLPVDSTMMARDLPMYLNRMRDQRQIAAFQEWFQRQGKEMNLIRAFATKSAKTAGS